VIYLFYLIFISLITTSITTIMEKVKHKNITTNEINKWKI